MLRLVIPCPTLPFVLQYSHSITKQDTVREKRHEQLFSLLFILHNRIKLKWSNKCYICCVRFPHRYLNYCNNKKNVLKHFDEKHWLAETDIFHVLEQTMKDEKRVETLYKKRNKKRESKKKKKKLCTFKCSVYICNFPFDTLFFRLISYRRSTKPTFIGKHVFEHHLKLINCMCNRFVLIKIELFATALK